MTFPSRVTRPLLFLCMIALFGALALAAARPTLAERGAAAQPCVGGMAGPYPCEGYDLMAFIPLDGMGAAPNTLVANLWGWTDPTTQKEYVLLGLDNATVFCRPRPRPPSTAT